MSDIEGGKSKSYNRKLYLKLGIAGFCFGNIMLLVLPEYLSHGNLDETFKNFIRYINLILAIPVLYSASEYFASAYTSLKLKHINIDVPISLGILVLLFGPAVEVEVAKEFKQSYLTELWNHQVFAKEQDSQISTISNTIAKYFTFGVLTIAITAFIYWLPFDLNIALNSMTAVLIIACPCALALTLPFTYGTMLRVFSRNSFFLKNDRIVEYLAKLDVIIFDKTGTLTDVAKSKIEYIGKKLSIDEIILIKSIVKHSTHPISKLIFDIYKGY